MDVWICKGKYCRISWDLNLWKNKKKIVPKFDEVINGVSDKNVKITFSQEWMTNFMIQKWILSNLTKPCLSDYYYCLKF